VPFPLEQSLPDATSLTPKTLLALLLNAILSSTWISHELAAKSIAYLIKADYHDIQVLKKASSEEKTVVLTKGGYTRYREKAAIMLDELVDLILEKKEKEFMWTWSSDGELPYRNTVYRHWWHTIFVMVIEWDWYFTAPSR
jgi:hypothetical protein